MATPLWSHAFDTSMTERGPITGERPKETGALCSHCTGNVRQCQGLGQQIATELQSKYDLAKFSCPDAVIHVDRRTAWVCKIGQIAPAAVHPV
jgi:hypothetical protein